MLKSAYNILNNLGELCFPRLHKPLILLSSIDFTQRVVFFTLNQPHQTNDYLSDKLLSEFLKSIIISKQID